MTKKNKLSPKIAPLDARTSAFVSLQTSLMKKAALAGDADAVRSALASGADPNACHTQNASCLITAVIDGHAGVATALLDAGADIDAEGADAKTALLASFERRGGLGAQMTALLCSRGACMGERRPKRPHETSNAMKTAIDYQMPHAVKIMVECGYDPEAKLHQSVSAIDYARSLGLDFVVECMLSALAAMESRQIEAALNGAEDAANAPRRGPSLRM